jgi:hypothetical protein
MRSTPPFSPPSSRLSRTLSPPDAPPSPAFSSPRSPDALDARWRRTLAELQSELSAERAARSEAEQVLADTTAALSSLRETSGRSDAAQPGGEAVAILREQLRVREAELATLRSARPGVCARCAEVSLALACHPTHRFSPEGRAPAGAGAAELLSSWLLLLLTSAALCVVWTSLLRRLAPSLLLAVLCCATERPRGFFGASSSLQAQSASLLLLFTLLSVPATLLWATHSPARLFSLLAYLGWLSFVDTAPLRGARRISSLSRCSLWRSLALPRRISLIKTAELDPSAQHIVCYSSESVSSSGALSAPAMLALHCPLACGWAPLFPGVTCRAALPAHSPAFRIPILRELLIALGLSTAGGDGVEQTLRASLSAGGALLLAIQPSSDDAGLRAASRAALRTGACLVPSVGVDDRIGVDRSVGTALLRSLLGLDSLAAPDFIGPLAGALRRSLLRLRHSAPPWPRLLRCADFCFDALAPRPGVSAVKIVVGAPMAVARATGEPTEAGVSALAAALVREMQALRAASGAAA